ncbi:phosphatidate cytidylyltransferase [Novosphingobium panipatense]
MPKCCSRMFSGRISRPTTCVRLSRPSPLASGAMAGAKRPKRGLSDLGVRTASAVVMIVVAGAALWLGGAVWTAFVCAISVGVLWEWVQLARAATPAPGARAAWNFAGMLYVGVGAAMLLFLRNPVFTLMPVVTLLLTVIAVDVGAYFAGRTFRGPKIAPSISPSRPGRGLWAVCSALRWCSSGQRASGRVARSGSMLKAQRPTSAPALAGSRAGISRRMPCPFTTCLMMGALAAVTAQAGDFFESWMKRRAGAKDSGALIPGHGGFFDRVDGLLAVLFMIGLLILFQPR